MKNEKLLSFAVAQINPKVGDFDYNKKLIIKYLECVAKSNTKKSNTNIDLLVFPELCICGYDPRDLVLRDDFCNKSYNVVEELVQLSANYDFGFIVGSIKLEKNLELDKNQKRYNAAFFIYGGEIIFEYKKRELPNYGVFDEKRLYSSCYDESYDEPYYEGYEEFCDENYDEYYYKTRELCSHKFESINFKGFDIGLLICEDLWSGANYDILCKSFSTKSKADNVTIENINAKNIGFENTKSQNLNPENAEYNNAEEKNKRLDLVITINSSPFWVGKVGERVGMIQDKIKKFGVPILYANMVGAQDSVVYDGGSMYFDSLGDVKFCADFFKEGLYKLGISDSKEFIFFGKIDDFGNEVNGNYVYDCSNLKLESNGEKNIFKNRELNTNASEKNFFVYGDSRDSYGMVYEALILGLRDYSAKNNFSSLTLGYSSGIDSTLVSLIATDSLGVENVNLISLPSIYTSPETFNDSREFLKLAGIEKYREIPINKIYDSFVNELGFSTGQSWGGNVLWAQGGRFEDGDYDFNGYKKKNYDDRFKGKSSDNKGCDDKDYNDIALQNLQARIRGNILMYFANKNNSLLLTTGNKSEIAVGYCTLYGDTNGGFNPIKDLYKTQVYEIAKWRNKNFTQNSTLKKVDLIPENILNKSPSAELKFNQKDSDSLPEYDVLDKILILYIDGRKSVEEIINAGFDKDIVRRIANLVRISQFKRSQSAIGTKISKMSFDLDFRYPITNGFT